MAEQFQQKQRRRGPGRRFQPGQSGNPAGRRRGTKNRATMLAERLLLDDIQDVVPSGGRQGEGWRHDGGSHRG
jgi:hypothetical protein